MQNNDPHPSLTFTVNGNPVHVDREPRRTLLTILRDDLGRPHWTPDPRSIRFSWQCLSPGRCNAGSAPPV
jgi:hypothetical protein